MTTLREVEQAREKFMKLFIKFPNYLIIGEYEWHQLKIYFRRNFKEDISDEVTGSTLFGCKILVDVAIRGFNFGYVLQDD